MYTLMTNDVEHTSITKNTLSKKTGKLVSEKGIPLLLSLYSKNDIKSTFYFTGEFASDFPSAVQKVYDHGHEVGCHGYSHKPEHSFDILSERQQYLHLKLAKDTIESICGPITSFRAPALRIGPSTPAILKKLGFKTDSSIAPQRFDGPLTFGSMRKLNWLLANRNPFFYKSRMEPEINERSVLEIPVSAALLAYQGTTMRISPKINSLLGDFLHNESTNKKKPIVFLFHPNELVKEDTSAPFFSRSKNIVNSFFADKLRRKLKLNNLGKNSIKLLQKVIDKSKSQGFKFVTAQEYHEISYNNLNKF